MGRTEGGREEGEVGQELPPEDKGWGTVEQE
jgi:hypothetical protein